MDSMTLSLTPEMGKALELAARRKGTTPESIVLSLVHDHVLVPAEEEQAPPPPGSLAELLEGYAGVFDSREFVPGGARLSERAAERFTDILEEKRKQGRL